MRDLCALRQQPHRLHQTQLLPPLTESHSRFLQEPSLDGAPACACDFADLRERPLFARTRQQRIRDAQRSRVRWIGQLQGNSLNAFEMVHNQIDHVALPFLAKIQCRQRAGMQNQFPQQRRHIHHATTPRQSPRQPRPQIQCSHRNRAGHGDAVRNRCRNPHRAVRRNHPCANACAHRHHSARGIHQLVAMMKMQRDNVSGRVVATQRCDLRRTRRARDRTSRFVCFATFIVTISKERKAGNRYSRLGHEGIAQ